MTNLRSLDLNLLTVFEAVFEAGSITRAAERLALSPSATSHALGRLRDACRDELFVRIGQGLAPTPVAQRIYPEVAKALSVMRQSIAEARGFEPATTTRQFHVAIPHPLGPSWALAIRGAAMAEAPGAVLRFDTRTLPVDPLERMRAAALDVAVDWMPPADGRFVLRRLFDDRLVLVAREGHPRIGPRSKAKVLREEQFVGIHARPGPQPEAILALLEASRAHGIDVRLTVSEFLEIPFLVAQTDLVGFMPASMAPRALTDARLQVVELEEFAVPIPVQLIWHETRRSDDGHRWLRDLVANTVLSAVGAKPTG